MKGYERSERKLNDTRPGDKHEREKKEASDKHVSTSNITMPIVRSLTWLA